MIQLTCIQVVIQSQFTLCVESSTNNCRLQSEDVQVWVLDGEELVEAGSSQLRCGISRVLCEEREARRQEGKAT